MIFCTKKTISILSVASVLTGCATTTPQQQERWTQNIPVCIGDSDCKVKWAAARDWVQSNAGYKIQIYSDDLIETYNPVANDPKIAASVSKKLLSKNANGDSTIQIGINVRCANIFGCVPTHDEAITSFNKSVSQAEINDPTCYINPSSKDDSPKLGIYTIVWKNRVLIKRVCSDSPAQRSGLMPNDLVQSINDTEINSQEGFSTAVKSFKFNENRTFNVIRDGLAVSVVVQLPSREEQERIRSAIVQKSSTVNALKPDAEKRLESLTRMLTNGLVTKSEFEIKKKQILEDM